VRSGVLGTPGPASVHWGARTPGAASPPRPRARRAELGGSRKASSPGLMGEVAIHRSDLVAEYLHASSRGRDRFGTTALWKDWPATCRHGPVRARVPGRRARGGGGDVASSVGGAHTLVRGEQTAACMLREKRAWLLKEADSPLLGWEVYARKDNVLEESGIALVADSTKILAAGEEPGQSSRSLTRPVQAGLRGTSWPPCAAARRRRVAPARPTRPPRWPCRRKRPYARDPRRPRPGSLEPPDQVPSLDRWRST
jgi:hypothetical protein